MSLSTARKTPFIFEGRILYHIDGEPGRLFMQQTYGEVQAVVQQATCWRKFRFTRCPEAELEIERLGWKASDEILADHQADGPITKPTATPRAYGAGGPEAKGFAAEGA